MRFCIVTPCLNGADFIDETILSVVSQIGPFSIRYHVQDGGSSDGTLEKLARWKRLLEGDFPSFCERIDFSYSSEKDGGIYDAVNRGFSTCGTGDVMSWINADDRLEPAACAIAAQLFQTYRDVHWITGAGCVIDEQGNTLVVSLLLYQRKGIQAGIFDRRFNPLIIQQEGSFWRSSLWEEVGGLDMRFRMAGDFDLWRRFATKTDLVSVGAVLGRWRYRAGQKSSDINSYYAEIDASLTQSEKEIRQRVASQFKACKSAAECIAAGFSARIARYGPVSGTDVFGTSSWRITLR